MKTHRTQRGMMATMLAAAAFSCSATTTSFGAVIPANHIIGGAPTHINFTPVPIPSNHIIGGAPDRINFTPTLIPQNHIVGASVPTLFHVTTNHVVNIGAPASNHSITTAIANIGNLFHSIVNHPMNVTSSPTIPTHTIMPGPIHFIIPALNVTTPAPNRTVTTPVTNIGNLFNSIVNHPSNVTSSPTIPTHTIMPGPIHFIIPALNVTTPAPNRTVTTPVTNIGNLFNSIVNHPSNVTSSPTIPTHTIMPGPIHFTIPALNVTTPAPNRTVTTPVSNIGNLFNRIVNHPMNVTSSPTIPTHTITPGPIHFNSTGNGPAADTSNPSAPSNIGQLLNQTIDAGISKAQDTVLNALNKTTVGKCVIVPVVKSEQDELSIGQDTMSIAQNGHSAAHNVTTASNMLNASKDLIDSGQDLKAQWAQATSPQCLNADKTGGIIGGGAAIVTTLVKYGSDAMSKLGDLFKSIRINDPTILPGGGGEIPIEVQGAQPHNTSPTTPVVGPNATNF